jgi:ClpP class serine protease
MHHALRVGIMSISIWDFLWVFLILISLLPVLKQQQLNMARLRLFRKIEATRGTRVISLIHRQESVSLLGIPLRRYIDIEDSEQILRAIRLTPDDMPIDLILHTPGGLVLASEQIAFALRNHLARVTVFVPHYAMSGGTMLALAADEIYMDGNAVLGPVDPQVGNYPAVSILKAIDQKNKNRVDDETLILADIAQKALGQVERTLRELLKDRYSEEDAARIARVFTEGRWTHDYAITCSTLREIGLSTICDQLPQEVYDLMDLYPQPAQRRPSVQFIPLPYGDRDQSGRK